MEIKLGQDVKINNQKPQEIVRKKLIVCGVEKCIFGKSKINDSCAICRNRIDFLVSKGINKSLLKTIETLLANVQEVQPILIKVTDLIIYTCYKKEGIPLYDNCPFGFKKVSEKCKDCARSQIKTISSKTEVIK